MLRKMNIFSIISLFFAVAVIAVASYSFTNIADYRYTQFMQLFLGLMLLFSGLSEFKRSNKIIAILNLGVSLFIFFVFFVILFTRN